MKSIRNDKLISSCSLAAMCLIFSGANLSGNDKDLPEGVQKILDRCSAAAIKTAPTPLVKAAGFMTMDRCAVTGNGCLMVTLTDGPGNISVRIGKTDFWADRNIEGSPFRTSNALAGYLNFKIPALDKAAFSQITDLRLGEIRTTLTQEKTELEIRTLTPHEEDNYLINELSNRGETPIAVTVETCAAQKVNPGPAFEIAAGSEGGIAWVTRKTPKMKAYDDLFGYSDHDFQMRIAVATRLFGAEAEPKADGTNPKEIRTSQVFTVGPKQTVRIITKVHSTGLPITRDPADPLPKNIGALQKLNTDGLEQMLASHQKWWSNYWRLSFVELAAEPLLERSWYGALYILACGTKSGQWPAGCNSWPVDDRVPWTGDYHWNYNNEAPYYGAYSSNRIAQSEPYERTVLAANEYGKQFAAKEKSPGTLFPLGTAPGHISQPTTYGQRTHALEASMNLINRYYYTHDLEWARTVYPFFRDVADYWDHVLAKDKEVRPNGSYRYVVKDSEPMETLRNDRFNGITSLAFLRRFYQAMTDLTQELNASGFDTGCGEKEMAFWKDILANLSDYPATCAYGHKVFAWSEQSLNPFSTDQSWILYSVFPTEQVTLGGNPELFKIARDTLIIRPRFYTQFLNNMPSIFAIAARLAHHPPEIIERFRTIYGSKLGVNNFLSGGGNFENCSVVEALNSFLLQSGDGVLRLFPCWHHPDAKFASLRANGAFLVSAEKKNGICQPITLMSEKGRNCRILNPWNGSIKVRDVESGKEVRVEGGALYAQVATFATEAAKYYLIEPKNGLPDKADYWNVALGKQVTASSNYKPVPDERRPATAPYGWNDSFKEADNWDVSKLTDGVRLNTFAGHRGWSSQLYDDGKHGEWIQIDLGELTPIKQVSLWPMAHGETMQNGFNAEPFVRSSEIDQSYDGFPVNMRLLVSSDGKKWDEAVAALPKGSYAKPAAGDADSDLKPADVTGPVNLSFKPCSARYVKIEILSLRKTRYFDKFAANIAEIEVIRDSKP